MHVFGNTEALGDVFYPSDAPFFPCDASALLPCCCCWRFRCPLPRKSFCAA